MSEDRSILLIGKHGWTRRVLIHNDPVFSDLSILGYDEDFCSGDSHILHGHVAEQIERAWPAYERLIAMEEEYTNRVQQSVARGDPRPVMVYDVAFAHPPVRYSEIADILRYTDSDSIVSHRRRLFITSESDLDTKQNEQQPRHLQCLELAMKSLRREDRLRILEHYIQVPYIRGRLFERVRNSIYNLRVKLMTVVDAGPPVASLSTIKEQLPTDCLLVDVLYHCILMHEAVRDSAAAESYNFLPAHDKSSRYPSLVPWRHVRSTMERLELKCDIVANTTDVLSGLEGSYKLPTLQPTWCASEELLEEDDIGNLPSIEILRVDNELVQNLIRCFPSGISPVIFGLGPIVGVVPREWIQGYAGIVPWLHYTIAKQCSHHTSYVAPHSFLLDHKRFLHAIRAYDLSPVGREGLRRILLSLLYYLRDAKYDIRIRSRVDYFARLIEHYRGTVPRPLITERLGWVLNDSSLSQVERWVEENAGLFDSVSLEEVEKVIPTSIRRDHIHSDEVILPPPGKPGVYKIKRYLKDGKVVAEYYKVKGRVHSCGYPGQ